MLLELSLRYLAAHVFHADYCSVGWVGAFISLFSFILVSGHLALNWINVDSGLRCIIVKLLELNFLRKIV